MFYGGNTPRLNPQLVSNLKDEFKGKFGIILGVYGPRVFLGRKLLTPCLLGRFLSYNDMQWVVKQARVQELTIWRRKLAVFGTKSGFMRESIERG